MSKRRSQPRSEGYKDAAEGNPSNPSDDYSQSEQIEYKQGYQTRKDADDNDLPKLGEKE